MPSNEIAQTPPAPLDDPLDATVTRRDVVNLFAAFASLPDEATALDVAIEAKRVLTHKAS